MKCLNLNEALVVYFEKNTMKTKTFVVSFDKDILDEAIERAKLIHTCVKTKTVPIAEAHETQDMKWMCNYCVYKEECDKIEKEKLEGEK